MSGDARRPWRSLGLVFLAYLAIDTLLKLALGTFACDFAGMQDEPSHVVTGLMVRDYLAGFAPSDPLTFAADYYLHYPKVAMGQWPPFFYLVIGLWTLLLGASTTSLLVMMSTLVAGVSTTLFALLRSTCGPPAAAVFGLVFLLLPATQELGSMVMTEVPLALACLLASACFGRFLEHGSARDGLAFGVLATLAILIKGNALALAFVPPLAIVLTGRWQLLRRPALYAAAAMVAVFAGPWYALTFEIPADTWAGGSEPTASYAARAIGFYARELFVLAGILVGVSALVGIARRPWREQGELRWAAHLAFVIGILIVHVVIPSSIDERHLVLAAPAWIMLAALGSSALVVERSVHTATLLALVMLSGFGVERLRLGQKGVSGFGSTARELLADESLDEAVLMIASDAIGEGAFVSATALGEERPGHVVLRATKVLCRSDWSGRSYEEIFANEDELAAYLDRVSVGMIVLDHSAVEWEWYPHQDMLIGLVNSRPEVWEAVGERDTMRRGERHLGALKLYRRVGLDQLPAPSLSFEKVFGRRLSIGPFSTGES